MSMVFVEYKIAESRREGYLAWAGKLQEDPRVEVYEGEGQPNLFVEMWRGLPGAAVEGFHAVREGRSPQPDLPQPWRELPSFVEGGMPKIRIWAFRKVK
ncbi:hypothetical protein J2T17_004272 [Paenibacillus mucilaginosus]|uniref:hypothetical protein n=1 Tax=Paenibacillus mucilaginosus TaxID=61624 RepID=UPI003D2382FC